VHSTVACGAAEKAAARHSERWRSPQRALAGRQPISPSESSRILAERAGYPLYLALAVLDELSDDIGQRLDLVHQSDGLASHE
jgi:hypothetical protein